MKDILERVLRQLPTYLPELVSLVSRPKTTIVPWVEGAVGDLTRPLVFVSMTVGLGFLLQLPQLGKEHDFATLVAGMAVFKVLALLGFAAVIHGAFVAIGGTAPFAATFSVYLYAVSPLYLLLVLLEIVGLGLLRAHDPVLAAASRTNPAIMFESEPQMRAFLDAMPAQAWLYVATALARVIAPLAWIAACWGAFRTAHLVSRGRSSIAGLVTLAAAYPFFWILGLVMLGMFGTPVAALR